MCTKYILFRARGKHGNINKLNERKLRTNNFLDLGFVEVISSPYKGIFTGVFLANQLASTDN